MKERKRRQNNRWLWAAVAGLTAVWMILALLVLNHWRIEVRMAGPEEAVVEYAGEYADPGAQALLCGTLFWRQGLELPLEITGVVDTGRLGSQEIVYRAQILGLWGQAVRRVTVRTAARRRSAWPQCPASSRAEESRTRKRDIRHGTTAMGILRPRSSARRRTGW